jgi:hypothetical protein
MTQFFNHASFPGKGDRPASVFELSDVTIEIRKLYKHYGKTMPAAGYTYALRGIDLEVR